MNGFLFKIPALKCNVMDNADRARFLFSFPLRACRSCENAMEKKGNAHPENTVMLDLAPRFYLRGIFAPE